MSEFTQGLDQMLPGEQTHCLGIGPSQLAANSDTEKLYSLLTDYNFIEAKLSESGVQPLIEDYDLATNPDILTSDEKADTLKLIQEAIRLSAHILAQDKTQLAAQLIARLMSFENTEIQAMLEQPEKTLAATANTQLYPSWREITAYSDRTYRLGTMCSNNSRWQAGNFCFFRPHFKSLELRNRSRNFHPPRSSYLCQCCRSHTRRH